ELSRKAQERAQCRTAPVLRDLEKLLRIPWNSCSPRGNCPSPDAASRGAMPGSDDPNGRCDMNNGHMKAVKTGKAKASQPEAKKRSLAKAAKSRGSTKRSKLSALDAAAKVLGETG